MIVSTTVNVETAAFQVGYQNPSQFSRKYARMFGAPPRRNVTDLRVLAGRTGISPQPEGSRKTGARGVQTGHAGGRVRLATGPM